MYNCILILQFSALTTEIQIILLVKIAKFYPETESWAHPCILAQILAWSSFRFHAEFHQIPCKTYILKVMLKIVTNNRSSVVFGDKTTKVKIRLREKSPSQSTELVKPMFPIGWHVLGLARKLKVPNCLRSIQAPVFCAAQSSKILLQRCERMIGQVVLSNWTSNRISYTLPFLPLSLFRASTALPANI
jgi:hypothetical protein